MTPSTTIKTTSGVLETNLKSSNAPVVDTEVAKTDQSDFSAQTGENTTANRQVEVKSGEPAVDLKGAVDA